MLVCTYSSAPATDESNSGIVNVILMVIVTVIVIVIAAAAASMYICGLRNWSLPVCT